MALDSYLGLIGAVQEFLGRGDATTARVDYGIDLCEAWFNKELRVREMETTNGSFTATNSVISHPSDWLAWKNLGYTIGGIRYQLKPLQSEARGQFSDGSTGPPMFYMSRNDGTLLIPSPDASYTYDGTYWQKVPALSASVSTNWVLSSYPDAYLFGTLTAMESFYVGDQRVPMWRNFAEEALRGIRRSADPGQVMVMRTEYPVY